MFWLCQLPIGIFLNCSYQTKSFVTGYKFKDVTAA